MGDEFISASSCLQEYFHTQLDTKYSFKIIIIDRIQASHFSFDQFKHHFKIKNTKEMHQKLIEVFSFRNDISQRRMMAEEALRLLISKHHVEVPHYLVLRQQKSVLESVQHNPDYHVYKTENSFKDMIKQLALKQTRELLFIDQLSYHESISVNMDDIKSYLNLLKRPRTKEFIYFNPPLTKIQGQEMPLPTQILKRCCLREKTLNHVIYHLTVDHMTVPLTHHIHSISFFYGPAGLTAGIYAARANLHPIIIEGKTPGGQLMGTTMVENWPGNREILGPTLMMNMREHARDLGCTIISEEVIGVVPNPQTAPKLQNPFLL